jgi:hypothetical protein
MCLSQIFKISVTSLALMTIAGLGTLSATTINLNTVSGTWSNPTGNPVNFSGAGTSTIHWGKPVSGNAQSGYNFTGLAPQNGLQLNTPFSIGTFTHYNFPITGNALTGVNLGVKAMLNINGTAVSFTGTYHFNHDETPNIPTKQDPNCCNDIVTFINNMAQLGTFKINGQDYTVALLGFKTSPNGSLLSQFSTIEGKTNTATLYAKITKAGNVGVPEPSTYLVLAGFLGTCGCLAARRKRLLARS